MPTDLNVGILAFELYIPSSFVSQEALEISHNVASGKFTKGLGQLEMGFCGDNEDINSICLTVVSKLLNRFPGLEHNIGRVSVGTESSVDKSKSVKSVLMRLFSSSSLDIEGCDVINACYGGTQALFDTIAWVESSAWDGRLAIVVTADIAVYDEGPARPTGGAGAVAMLIGPNAPLVFSPIRSSFSTDVRDFFKPRLSSEYPIVNGKTSIDSYLNAVSQCWSGFKSKYLRKFNTKISVNDVDFLLFHAPFHKMVQKAFNRLIEDDLGEQSKNVVEELFQSKVLPGQTLCRRVGNMYCASLYGSLISLIFGINFEPGQKVLMFSYGSGLCSSMFLIETRDVSSTFDLRSIKIDLNSILSSRVEVEPNIFSKILNDRCNFVKTIESGSFDCLSPTFDCSTLFDGTFYISHVDSNLIRHYDVKN
ncbi:hypothetical protein RCL1_000909 [Eukaryota sp. TZLM3-RCL]